VIAEYGEGRLRQAFNEGPKLRLASRMSEQVPGDADQIRLPCRDPIDAALYGAGAARGDAEMEVREMRNAEPV
jgi:hypothetical protein